MNINCNEELVYKLLQKLTIIDDLEINMKKQLKIRNIIEEAVYEYEILSKSKDLIASDILEKISYFLKVKRLEGMSKKTISNYKYILLEFSKYINKPVSLITTVDIRIYLDKSSENIKETSLNTKISSLRSFFSWLVDEEFIVKNPMNKIRTTKVPKKLRTALKSNEVVQIKNGENLTIRERAILSIFLNTGCRLSEIVELNKSDINWNDRTFVVKGKGDKERLVYFNEECKYHLSKYLESRVDNNISLFVSKNKPYNRLMQRGIQYEFKEIKLKSNLEANLFPHLARHTYSQNSVDNGMQIATLSHILGHTNLSTTKRYFSINNDMAKYEYNKIHN